MFTDTDRDILLSARASIKQGNLSKFKTKKMMEEIKKSNSPQSMLGVIKDFEKDLQPTSNLKIQENKNEVILSKCFYKG